MTQKMQAQAAAYKDLVTAMDVRVMKQPDMSRWTKKEWDDFEEARQDPFEASEAMTKYLKKLADNYSEKKKAMDKRVKARPDMTRWTKSQWEQIEEARQDPEEALEA